MLMPLSIAFIVAIGGLFAAAPASAEGDKNRLGDEDITEGYVLCQKAGVEQVVIEHEGISVVINCADVPGPSAQK
jgi:hypothetical protein